MSININNIVLDKTKNITFNNKSVKKVIYNDKTVWEKINPIYMMDNDDIVNKPVIKKDMPIGEAILNLTNGYFRFASLDTSEGSGSFNLSISHIYNSKLNYDYVNTNIRTYMGEGMKLNVQEYLLDKNGKYIYIDAVGNAVLFDQNNNIYYDTLGLGLLLTRGENDYIITDKENNKSVFNINGYIIKKITKFNTIFNYTYENNKLTQIQKDSDNRGYKFKYYESNGLLKRIDSIYPNANKINFEYKEDKLVRVYKSRISNERTIIEYVYNNKGKLGEVYNISKQGLKFFYDSVDRLVKMSSTAVIEGTISQEKNYFNVNYTYTHKGYTEVVNDKNIKYVYTFNINTLREDVIYEDAKHLNNNITTITSVSPSSDVGMRVLEKAPISQKSFNGCKSITMSISGINNFFDVYETDEGRILDKLKEVDAKRRFTISAWVKVNSITGLTNSTISLKFSTNNVSNTALINKQKVGFYQYVSCELEFSKDEKIRFLKTELHKDTGITNANLEIADIRIIYNELMPTLLKNYFETLDLRDINGIKVNDSTYYGIQDVRSANVNYFLTPEDIKTTLFNKYMAKGGVFNVSLNNGRKILGSVKYIIIYKGSIDFPIALNNEIIPFFYMSMTMDGKLFIYNYEYYKSENNSDFIYQRTRAIKDNKESYKETKHNLKGLMIESVDEYKIRSYFEYDDVGNVTKKTIRSDLISDPTEKIVEEYIYNNKESLSKVKDERSNENTYYSSTPYNNLNAYIDYNRTLSDEFEYDTFQENILKRSHYVKENQATYFSFKNQVSYSYDILNRLKAMENDNVKYEMGYNVFNELNTLKINNNTIYTKEYIHDINETSKITYQNDSSKTYISQSDIYGRASKSYENSTLKCDYHYIDADGIRITSGAKIQKVLDYNSNLKHSYEYNDEHLLNEYIFEEINNSNFKMNVKAVPVMDGCLKEYQYSMQNGTNSYNLSVEETYENIGDILIEPRLLKIKSASVNIACQYDNLGRINFIMDSMLGIKKVFYYYDNIKNNIKQSTTTLVNKVETVKSSNLSIIKTEELEYDKNGNVTKITETKNNIISVKSYKYNASNEIIEVVDTKSNNTKTNTTNYDNYGNITSRTKDGLKRVYNYNSTSHKDRLMSINYYNANNQIVSTNSMSYDNIGNPLNYGNKTFEWIRGNLLHKINNDVVYTYSETGNRTNKIFSNYTKKYYLDDDKILGETLSDGSIKTFHYDKSGISGMFYKNSNYFLEKDNLGNIIAIYKDPSLNPSQPLDTKKIASYEYDEYGKCSIDYNDNYSDALEIAKAMPFRWKSYYYDEESEYYYINGNYYDPEVGRYITTASLMDIGANVNTTDINLYTFASNNPVMMVSNIHDYESSLTLVPKVTKKTWFSFIISAILFVISIALIIVAAIASCNPMTLVIGIMLIVTDVMLFTMQLADMIENRTGNNFLRNGIGWSQSKYNKVRVGLTVANIILTIAFAVSLRFSQCFKEGTNVLTEDGNKAIEDIKEGDMVLSYDENTGKQGYKKVIRLFRNSTKLWVELTVKVDGKEQEPISCTPEHPFYILNVEEDTPLVNFEERNNKEHNGQWVSAKDLKSGDVVLLESGKHGTINRVEIEKLGIPEVTYNFEVADFHTYYVGEEGILVHNMCPGADDLVGSADDVGIMTNKQAAELADQLGYSPTNYRSQGQTVFKNAKGNRFITQDITSHNGGVWKMADSVEKLASRATRMGTYDKFLKVRIGN